MELRGPIEILVVENNDIQRENIVALIDTVVRDASIASVAGTKDAMELLLGSPDAELPRLVILDLDLGDSNGMDLLKRIRTGDEHAPLTHVPIVIFTDSRDEECITEAYRLGVNSYVVKPFDYLEFRRVVQVLVQYWFSQNQTTAGYHPP
jgi:CheY-like chemotaxis protein